MLLGLAGPTVSSSVEDNHEEEALADGRAGKAARKAAEERKQREVSQSIKIYEAVADAFIQSGQADILVAQHFEGAALTGVITRGLPGLEQAILKETPWLFPTLVNGYREAQQAQDGLGRKAHLVTINSEYPLALRQVAKRVLAEASVLVVCCAPDDRSSMAGFLLGLNEEEKTPRPCINLFDQVEAAFKSATKTA